MASGCLDIPKGWAYTSLDSVCQILDSQRIPINNAERSRRIAGKSANELYPYYGATGQVGVIDGFIFDGEHILLGEDGAPFLDSFKVKSYLVSGKFWVNNHAHILNSFISNRYLCHYLNQIDYSDHVTGTTRFKLTQNALKRIPVLVAPIEEQHRIVAKIEELFFELDKGVEQLKTVRAKFDIYRQAVLKHAFQGKLTTEWDKENKNKLETANELLERIKFERRAYYERQLKEWNDAVKEWEEGGKLGKKPQRPKKPREIDQKTESMGCELEGRWTIPNNWVWTSLSKIGDIVAGGTPSTKEPSYWADEVSWISPADLTGYSSKTIKKGAKSISKIGLAKSSAKVMPAGSVHFSSRAPIGYVVISAESLATNQGFKSVVPAPGILSDYVYYYLMASREYACRCASGTTFLELSGQAFGNLQIPIAPTSMQRRIVDNIEENFSQVDKILEEIDSKLTKAEMLRQSILRRAFAGQLVAQDPSDEPVSVLLDKLKVEKEQIAKKIRKRRASA